MVSYACTGYDMVSGFTVVKGQSFFERMQHLDWLYFMGLLMGLSRWGLHTTAVGNNMLVRKSAYDTIGGYEHIPFSVTEDYALYSTMLKNGFTCKHTLDIRSINASGAQPTLTAVLHQRKRWLTGATQMPIYWWIIFLVFGSFIPIGVVLIWYAPIIAMIYIFAKWYLQLATIRFLAAHFQLPTSKADVVLYEAYLNLISLLIALYAIFPSKVKWKNRTY
jgi:cellulose synthase/poly-beta-1,6-N-acetylglucosamine synthase-like glycosyltransferase